MPNQAAAHFSTGDDVQRWRVRWPKLIPVIILAAGMCAFANSFKGVFVLDDTDHILNDASVRGFFPLAEHFYHNDRRPVSKFTFMVNYALGRYNPWGYHAVNLAIHLIAALTLYGLVRRTLWLPRFGERFAVSGSWIAMTCALFWMLHPLQTQSVTYIVQREESLMGMFYLLTLYGVVRGATAGRYAWPWYVLAVLSCLLGMGTKEVMITAPFLVLLYDWTFLTSSGLKSPLRRLGLYVPLFLTCGLLRVMGMADVTSGKGNAGFNIIVYSWHSYLFSQPEVILHYLRLCFWPDPLCLDYADWKPPSHHLFLHIVLPTIVIGAMVVASAWGIWKKHWLGFLGGAFFLILAPSSSIMPILDLVMEHRMYLPLAAVVIAVVVGAWAALDYAQRQEPLLHRSCMLMAGGLTLITALLLGLRTVQRNMDYETTIDMYRSVTEARPQNARGWHNYGLALGAAHRIREGIPAMLQAVNLHHGDVEGWVVLATMYADDSVPPDPDEAIALLRRGLGYAPGDPRLYKYTSLANYDLGALLYRKNPADDQGEALKHLRLATQQSTQAHVKLAPAWELLGRVEVFKDPQVAAADFREAIAEGDNDMAATGHDDLANLAMHLGRYDEAVSEYKLALNAQPVYLPFYNSLGEAQVKAGQWADAQATFTGVLKQSKPGDPINTDALANLGELAAMMGQYQQGMAQLRQAVQSVAGTLAATEYTRRLAWVLATAPPPYRDPAQALTLAQQANQQSDNQGAPFLNTLAAAYAANGRFADALQASRQALAAAQHFQDPVQVVQSQAQIQAYQAGKIWTVGAPPPPATKSVNPSSAFNSH